MQALPTDQHQATAALMTNDPLGANFMAHKLAWDEANPDPRENWPAHQVTSCCGQLPASEIQKYSNWYFGSFDFDGAWSPKKNIQDN